MPTSFRATAFSVLEQDGVLITTLGAHASDDDRYLMLQRTLAPSRQDTALGMDKPYLEYCDQLWSWYGEIDRFELFGDRVVATMSRAAAGRMGNDGILGAEFDLDPAEFAALRQALETTFRGSGSLVIRAS